jgi:hypothetical protein
MVASSDPNQQLAEALRRFRLGLLPAAIQHAQAAVSPTLAPSAHLLLVKFTVVKWIYQWVQCIARFSLDIGLLCIQQLQVGEPIDGTVKGEAASVGHSAECRSASTGPVQLDRGQAAQA